MYTCKPAKRSTVFIYILIIAAALALSYLAVYFERFLGSALKFILLAVWLAAAVFLVIILPIYYRHTKATFSEQEIRKYTFMFTHKYQYMSMHSVTSVTTLITPLSSFTGLNMVIVNALGARMFLFFISKNDCIKITDFFNDIISSREKS